jgi:glutamyl-tRNA synthetase
MVNMIGRFAPSPTGDLHLGNLRTAAVAWLSARAAGGTFIVRIEDLDRFQSSVEHERAQLADLAAIGLDWDGAVVHQSERFALYEHAIDRLRSAGLVYECFCSRREIREEIEASPRAPHGLTGSYPGTCRDLTEADRDARQSDGRPSALRLRTEGQRVAFTDRVLGETSGPVDDVVLRRNDGVPAYNLAVVVDDAVQTVTEVVRGNDLVSSTPRQVLLQQLLGLPAVEYLHVPLVVDDGGERLAKRQDNPITLRDLQSAGVSVVDVVSWIGVSLGLASPSEQLDLDDLVDRFDPALVPLGPCEVPTFT